MFLYGWMLKKVWWMDEDNLNLNKDKQIVYKMLMSVVRLFVDIVILVKVCLNVLGLMVLFILIIDLNGDNWFEVVRNVFFDYG